jgi:hypothetical protein
MSRDGLNMPRFKSRDSLEHLYRSLLGLQQRRVLKRRSTSNRPPDIDAMFVV